jgi:hypothetical protein
MAGRELRRQIILIVPSNDLARQFPALGKGSHCAVSECCDHIRGTRDILRETDARHYQPPGAWRIRGASSSLSLWPDAASAWPFVGLSVPSITP